MDCYYCEGSGVRLVIEGDDEIIINCRFCDGTGNHFYAEWCDN